MKRLGLFIYAVALWFIGIVGLLPMTVIFRVCTKEYSSARIWAIENTLKFIYEYRYRVLQLTNKKRRNWILRYNQYRFYDVNVRRIFV